MAESDRLEQISAALDSEGAMPSDLSAQEGEFLEASQFVRSALRIGPAEEPPDVTESVLRAIAADPRRELRSEADTIGLRHTRRPAESTKAPFVLVAAAVFVVACAIGAVLVWPSGPGGPSGSASATDRVLAYQRAISEFHANLTLTEYGAHPDIAERTMTGTLSYESPETLRLHLEQAGDVQPGWPENTLDVVLDGSTAYRRGLANCPVTQQPGCLREVEERADNLVPFSPTWIAPLDLVVPTDAFLPAEPTDSTVDEGVVVVNTTAARVSRLLGGLSLVGAIRSVHPTDPVRLVLDATDLTLRSLEVSAADNIARTTWGATNGYADPVGSTIMRLDVEPTSQTPQSKPELSAAGGIDAGFSGADLEADWPDPPGFTRVRSGLLEDGGPATQVFSYSNGRAWIRIDTTEEWDEKRLFGGLGPLVRPLSVGSGIGYSDPTGSRVALHTNDREVVVSGSVSLDELIEVAAQVGKGEPVPSAWTESGETAAPNGALVPPGDYVARSEDDRYLVAVGGPGETDLLLDQQLATSLAPPAKGDVVETSVRGVPARYLPRLGALVWLEDGWQRELRSVALDLDALRAAAESLVEP